MSKANKKAIAAAVFEGAESAAQAYGGTYDQWVKRAVDETAAEWNLTPAQVWAAATDGSDG